MPSTAGVASNSQALRPVSETRKLSRNGFFEITAAERHFKVTQLQTATL